MPFRRGVGWRRWGPYLSDRQWGTVREDYSADGEAWTHFTHELARSRAYRWGEDGIGGFSDANQRWCLGASLWERPRPHPQGAAVRPHQRRGQSRRGRQGTLLAISMRLPSPCLYVACCISYPQAAFPYRASAWTRMHRRGLRRCAGIRAGSIPACLTKNRYLRCHHRIRQGASPDDILMRISVVQSWPRHRAARWFG